MWKLKLMKTEARTRPGGLILNQYGVPRCGSLSSTNMGSEVRGLSLKRAEARTRPEGLSSTNMGSEVRGLNLKRAEARTRPEGLSSTNMGSEVRGPRTATQPIWVSEARGLNLKKAAEGLSSTNMGFRGAWSQPEEGGGKDKAGRAYPQPMWVSEVWKLKLKKTEAREGREGLSSTNMGFRGLGAQAEED